MTSPAITLTEYISKNIKTVGLKGWLAINPEIKVQIDRVLVAGTSPSIVHEWLVTQCGYPLSRTSIQRYAMELQREAQRAA